MSIKASLQFIAQINHFMNIDMPNQGTFCIGISIYQQINKHKIYANTYELMEQPVKYKKNKKIVLPSRSTLTHFYSKVAIIKYVDQKIALDDIIRFKMQIEGFPSLKEDDIFLQVNLHFSSKYPTYEGSHDKTFTGKIVATKVFRVQLIKTGIMNYFQAEFLEDYPSRCGITLFMCISNFKFGKYRLPHVQEVMKQVKEGEVVTEQLYSANSKKNLKEKELQRLQINSFSEMVMWISKYYHKKIPNPFEYFYSSYVKNLRYYFYLSQLKTCKSLRIQQNPQIKVPNQFYEQEQGTSEQKSTAQKQKIFQKYMTDYFPVSLTQEKIFMELHEIYNDIFQYLHKMEQEFVKDQINLQALKLEYNNYMWELYGQRVFKSVVYAPEDGQIQQQNTNRLNSEQNKLIAKKMREKESSSAVEYPIVDVDFLNNKDNLQYVFYEITYPAKNKQNIKKQMLLQENHPQNLHKSSKMKQQQQNYENLSQKIQQNNEQQKLDKQNEIIKQQQKNPKQQNTQKQHKKQTEQEQDELIGKTIFEDQQQFRKPPQVNSQIFGSQFSDIQTKNKQQEESDHDIGNDGARSDKGEKDLTEHMHEEEDNLINFKINKEIQEHKLKEYKLQELGQFEQKDLLFVMCHGYQGSSYDMMLIYRGLKQNYPRANFLPSRSNQSQTNGDINEMGKRLAEQIVNFIRNYLDEDKVIINMIGHSMGGIIARAALPYIPKRLSKFGFYFSLSSPHLGYLHGVQQKIKAGLWIIRKVNPTRSLQQLSMSDSSDPRKTFLYKLSTSGSLKRFQKVILWSSFEDSYVAWHSARIMVHGHKKKTQSIKVEEQMVSNILGVSPIHRLDMNFNVKKNNIDGIIGRTAHINLIVQQSLFKIINATIPELFDLRKN